ncbi:MAG: ABC transporter substrate-binding protein [Devosia sp.]
MAIHPTRRHFLAGTAALLGSSALLRAATAQENNLRLIFWGSQPRADRTYAVADLYTAAHPDVSIGGEFLAWPDYWPKLATQTAGGNQPDIMQMDYRYIGEYARRGTLAPLDDLAGGPLDIAGVDADQLANGTIDGKLYGISLGVATGATVTNAQALEANGIEIDPMGITYDDLLTKGQALKAATNGAMALSSDGSGVELLMENWLRQRGKALYTPDGKTAFTAADVTEWFELWAELRAAGACLGAEEQALDTGKLEETGLIRGKAAMNFTTSNQLVTYQALTDQRLGIAIYPMIAPNTAGGHYRNSSQFFTISAGSTATDAAASFISFFVNSPDAGKILGVERGVPVTAAVRDAIAPTLDEQSALAVKFVAALGAIAGAVPPSPPAAAGEVEVALKTKSQEVSFGAQSPADAGPAFFDQVNDILSRAG